MRLLGSLSIYALSVITSTLPKGSPIARTAAALGCVHRSPGFSARRCLRLLEEVWGALWRGQTGKLGAGFTTLLWLSRRACFLDLLAARIDVYEENERRSTPHAVLVRRTGCLRWSKTSPHTAHQRALLERLFSHPKVRSHDSSTVSATRATTSLGCGIRSATAASVGARIRPNRQ